MSLNYREINLILEELSLNSSRIERFGQPDRFSLYVETRKKGKNQHIQIGLYHNYTRICRMGKNPKLPLQPPRFAQLLSSRLKGGLVESISQPGEERILHWVIINRNKTFNLWIRLWSSNPNVILTGEDNIIIDCLFRRKKQNELSGAVLKLDSLLKSENPNKKVREIRSYDGFNDFNSFIDYQYNKIGDIDVETRKKKLLSLQSRRQKALVSSLKKIQARIKTYRKADEMQLFGDLLSNHFQSMKKGMDSVQTYNYLTGDDIYVPLKTDLTPFENRDRYYRKARKYRKGRDRSEKELVLLQKELEKINQIKLKIQNAEDISQLPELTLIQNKSNQKKNQPSSPGLRFQSNSFEILVGRNSRENDILLRQYSRGNDMWLHVRQFPGGFVIIKHKKGKSIPLETLLDAANLALLYSSAKKKINGDVHYTEIKNLRRIKGGKARPGTSE